MIIFQNQNVIKMTISENQVWYWGGCQFVINPASAKRYSTGGRATRMLNAICLSAMRGGAIWQRQEHLLESETYGLLEVCVAVIDDRANRDYYPRRCHTGSWLKGLKSWCGAA